MRPILKSRDDGSCMLALIIAVAMIIVYTLAFSWFYYHGIAMVAPTTHNHFWWGIAQGFFVIPSLLTSLIQHSYSIYQSPNTGAGYNCGYVIGLFIFFGILFRSSR